MLACKPQLALLTPLALVASGRWRVLGVAVLGAALLALSAGLTLGWQAYPAFLRAGAHGEAIFAAAGPVAWSKVQTVYGIGRFVGAPLPVAAALQLAVSIACALGIWRVWRGPWPFAIKAACLAAAVPLATPYAFIYDAAVLGVGLAFLLRDAAERSSMVAAQAAVMAFFALIPLTWLNLGIPTVPFASAGLLAIAVSQAKRRPSRLRHVVGGSYPTPARAGEIGRI